MKKYKIDSLLVAFAKFARGSESEKEETMKETEAQLRDLQSKKDATHPSEVTEIDEEILQTFVAMTIPLHCYSRMLQAIHDAYSD